MVHYLVVITHVRKYVIVVNVEIARGLAREPVHVEKLVIFFLPFLFPIFCIFCLFVCLFVVCLFVGRFVMAASVEIVRGLASEPVHVGKPVIIPSLWSPLNLPLSLLPLSPFSFLKHSLCVIAVNMEIVRGPGKERVHVEKLVIVPLPFPSTFHSPHGKLIIIVTTFWTQMTFVYLSCCLAAATPVWFTLSYYLPSLPLPFPKVFFFFCEEIV